jgi:hypothetical protein
MTLVALWLVVGAAASDNEMPDSWVKTTATVVSSETDDSLLGIVLNSCGKAPSHPYRVAVRFNDQEGNRHRAEMNICSHGNGPAVGYSDYKIAYNPANPQQVRQAPLDGFGILVAIMSAVTVVAAAALYLLTKHRGRRAAMVLK